MLLLVSGKTDVCTSLSSVGSCVSALAQQELDNALPRDKLARVTSIVLVGLLMDLYTLSQYCGWSKPFWLAFLPEP